MNKEDLEVVGDIKYAGNTVLLIDLEKNRIVEDIKKIMIKEKLIMINLALVPKVIE